MIEEVITVGNCEENKWRRDNLLKCKNLVDMGDHYTVSFTSVSSNKDETISLKLTYKILK